MSKDKRLGRGLAALLSTPENESDFGHAHDSEMPRLHTTSHEGTEGQSSLPRGAGLERLVMLNIDEVDPNPFQPRREFRETEIASLAESLKEHEQLQPILVRQVDGRWQLISGERRWRAAKQAGMSHIKAQVRDADDRLVAELAIVENLQRKDLNPIEKALSFKRYIEQHDCRQEDLAKRLKIDRSTIANLLRLLELPEEVQQSLQQGTVSNGHARALLPLGDEQAQIKFCRRIREEGMSVRETERIVQEMIAVEDGNGGTISRAAAKKRQINQHLAALEQQLKQALGAKVEVRQGAGGRGKIMIHFKNHDDFERLRSYLVDDSVSQLRAG